MSIAFIHPPVSAFRSGGNHYNANILQQAEKNCLPLVSLPVNENRPLHEALRGAEFESCRLMVLDSFFFSTFCPEHMPSNRPPLALLLHDLPSANPKLTLEQRRAASEVENVAMAVADRFIVTGLSVQTILLKRDPKKPTFLCEPGIDPIFFPQHSAATNHERLDQPVQYVTVANLLPRKDYHELLSVLARLSHCNWHWHVVGDETRDTAYASLFRQTIKNLDLDDRITLHGPLALQQLSDLMDRADIFISASDYETYGMALAEASAKHLPVVTTRVGEAERIIRHGETGYLVAVGDWDSFATYLLKLTEDRHLRREFKNRYRSPPRCWEQTFADFRKACDCG